MNKVIYDSNCELCIKIKIILEKLDFFNQFSWISSNNSSIELDKYGLNEKLLDTTIIIVKNNNKILLEFEACRYIISRIPVLFPMSILFYIPFLSSFLGIRLYRIISKNRKCDD